MPIVNRFHELAAEIADWRRDLHAHPELGYEVHRTAATVAARLAAFGVDEVATGIGRTGVVGVIRGRGAGPTIALRADMDALPIDERSGRPWASATPGVMHACGHDGHTAMLLGAAKHLAETRNFAGTVVVVFQPAEEGGAGAKAMIDDGLLDRFGVERIFGMHNMPGLAMGTFATRPGPMMAAADTFKIKVAGRGGHAARPHMTRDPVVAGAAIVMAAQTIVSRSVDPNDAAVVSITAFNAGRTTNVIPGEAELKGTIRTLDMARREEVMARLREIVAGLAAAHAVAARITIRDGYPVLVNDAGEAAFAAEVAARVVGAHNVDAAAAPSMGGEDFAFLTAARPGAFVFAGIGAVADLHNDRYDFDDALIPYGCSYWTTLVETALPRGA